MSYQQHPANTNLSIKQFVEEMNKALQSLSEYKHGMVVCADSNGYWLERFGVKDTGNNDLLSISRNLVLSKRNM
jgi:hypothetical protein